VNILLPDKADPRILRVCAHIVQNPSLDLSVKTLASISFLSPFHFIRLFKREILETPHQFVARIRIEKAKELLSGKAHTVTDIGLLVGFESMGSFSRIFHKTVGWSPSVYRARVWAMHKQPARFIPHCYIHQFGLAPHLQRQTK